MKEDTVGTLLIKPQRQPEQKKSAVAAIGVKRCGEQTISIAGTPHTSTINQALRADESRTRENMIVFDTIHVRRR